MANKILGGSFTLTAVVDGRNYTALVVNMTSTALAQFVSPSGEVTPNWKNSNPKVAMVVYDQEGNEIKGSSIQNLKMIYNGTEVVAGQSFPNITYLPSEGAVRFNDNVASLSNANDDSFVLEGEITVSDGVNIKLQTAPQTIQIIQTASGTAYLCLVEGKNISGDMTETVLTATIIDHTGEKVTTDGWSFTWFRVEGAREVQIGSGINSLTVSSDDVNGFQLFKCVASKNGAEAEPGYCQIKDDTDPYYIGIVQEGVSGDRISEGQTAIYKATIVDKNGDTASGFNLTPSWSVVDNLGNSRTEGDDYTISTTKWNKDTIKLTYAQVLAMGTAYGYVSGVITKAT